MKKIIHRAHSLKFKYFISLALLGLVVTYLLAISISFNDEDEVALLDPPITTETAEIKPEFNKEEFIIKKNSSLYESLTKAGLTGQQVAKIVSDTKPIYNFAYISAGTEYTLFKDDEDQVRKISFKLSELSHLVITEYNDGWMPEIVNIPTTKSTVHFSGKVTDNLWNSGIRANLPPLLIVSLAEVFAWQVDFAREVRVGDSWEFTIEKISANGRTVDWGNILEATYINAGTEFKAYYFQSEDPPIKGHFDSLGNSLRKIFLKSPIKFGRITSRVSRRRFHPIHKVFRAHRGVDYAAPTGTPIRSIGTGYVQKIGHFGASGNMVVIRHTSGYTTKYLHLSRFQKGIKPGHRVQQGQVIGYVGQTGSATGPHLHFELWKANTFIDPLRVKLPSAEPLPQQLMARFLKQIGKETLVTPSHVLSND